MVLEHGGNSNDVVMEYLIEYTRYISVDNVVTFNFISTELPLGTAAQETFCNVGVIGLYYENIDYLFK